MIKIEVTGNSIPEVADKLLAIGASLRSTATEGWSAPKHTVVGAEVAKGAALFSAPIPVDSSVSVPEDISPAALEEAEVEVAEAAPVDPTSSTSAIAADVLSSQPTTKEPSTTPAPAAELNFDIDVAPHVLQVVKEKGKPVAQEILSQFGVEKASLLDPALWPELVQQLKDAL